MRKDKRMYKLEIRRLEQLTNSLRSGTKLNGTTVILGETNAGRLLTALDSISMAIYLLNKIENA